MVRIKVSNNLLTLFLAVTVILALVGFSNFLLLGFSFSDFATYSFFEKLYMISYLAGLGFVLYVSFRVFGEMQGFYKDDFVRLIYNISGIVFLIIIGFLLVRWT